MGPSAARLAARREGTSNGQGWSPQSNVGTSVVVGEPFVVGDVVAAHGETNYRDVLSMEVSGDEGFRNSCIVGEESIDREGKTWRRW